MRTAILCLPLLFPLRTTTSQVVDNTEGLTSFAVADRNGIFKNAILLLTAIWSIIENKLNVKSRPTALKPKNANVTRCGDCFAASWLECIGLAHAESTVQ